MSIKLSLQGVVEQDQDEGGHQRSKEYVRKQDDEVENAGPIMQWIGDRAGPDMIQDVAAKEEC